MTVTQHARAPMLHESPVGIGNQPAPSSQAEAFAWLLSGPRRSASGDGNRVVALLTSGNFARGEHAFAVLAPSTAGAYTIRLDATDLAGNYAQ